MTISTVELFGDQVQTVRNALRSGGYQLLLGAGASYGATNSSGATVPGVSELVRRMSERFPDARISTDTRLARAYQRAVQSSGTDEVWRFLQKQFNKCRHRDWFVSLAGMPWRRVWTLNLDDTFETSYARSVRDRTARLKVIDWVDEYSESRGPEIIHLHGRVYGNVPTPVIFSLSEYNLAAQAHGVWHKVLRGLLASEPFVIIGASLLDDPDIESMIVSSRPSSPIPSIIVDPHISDDNAWELANQGYIIVRETAEEWSLRCEIDFDMERTQLHSLYQKTVANLPQFSELRKLGVTPNSLSHDYLGGSEPNWTDANSGLIARFGWFNEVWGQVRQWNRDPGTPFAVANVYASRLSGATSGLLSIARSAAEEGMRVLAFDRSASFDPNIVHEFARGNGSILILIDSGYSFARDVDALGRLVSASADTRVVVLMVDRPNRESIVEEHLSPEIYSVRAFHVENRRTRGDARAISQVLAREGRLDWLETKSQDERANHFANKGIFESMGKVEGAAGFRSRLDREIGQLSVPWHRDLLLIATLASFEDAQLGLMEASFALDVPVASIIAACFDDDHLSALVEVDGDLLSPRHRGQDVATIARAFRSTSFLTRLSVILLRLASLTAKDGHRTRSRASSLVGHLMGARLLRELTKDDGAIVQFYQTLLPAYGDWNARYWEQRSILARQIRKFDTAVSFAERAVSLWDDSFSRNTLAVNLIAKAEHLLALNQGEWSSHYSRGWSEFETAVTLEGPAGVSEWARLEVSLRILERLAQVLGWPQEWDRVRADWSSAYLVLRLRIGRVQGSTDEQRADKLSSRYSAAEERRLSSEASLDGQPDWDGAFQRVVLSYPGVHQIDDLKSLVVDDSSLPRSSDWGGYGAFDIALKSVLPASRFHLSVPDDSVQILPAAPSELISAGAGAGVDDARLLHCIVNEFSRLVAPTPLSVFSAQVARALLKPPGVKWGSYKKFKDALLAAVPTAELDGESGTTLLLPTLVVEPDGG